jgi:hypothetical protein
MAPLPVSFVGVIMLVIVWIWKSGDSLQKSIPIGAWQGGTLIPLTIYGHVYSDSSSEVWARREVVDRPSHEWSVGLIISGTKTWTVVDLQQQTHEIAKGGSANANRQNPKTAQKLNSDSRGPDPSCSKTELFVQLHISIGRPFSGNLAGLGTGLTSPKKKAQYSRFFRWAPVLVLCQNCSNTDQIWSPLR